MKTPDQEVSERIVDLFREQDILEDESLNGLAENLMTGKMKPNDWKMLFKLDAVKGEPHADHKDET